MEPRRKPTPRVEAVKHNQNNAFSSNRPLIRMSVSDTVVGSGNAFRCFNENECEPLNDRVLYGTIGPINNTTRYVFLTAPMDTRTPFSGFARGASAEVSSTAALLGAIQTISEFIHAKANASGLDPNTEITNPSFFSRTLAFGFFPGTNFGNFGAKKFLCNIYLRNKPTANHQSNEPTFNNQSTTRASLRKHRSSSSEKINKRVKAKWLMDRFSEEKAGIENNDPLTQISRASDYANLTVDRIDSLISIGHLSIPTPPSKTTKLFIHAEHTADSTALQATMKNAADAAKTKLAMTIDTETVSTLLTPGIPPSPAGAFVQEREDIPTVHLATHGPTFDMPYYHSHLDRFYNLDAICDASTLAARTALVQLGIPSAEVDVSNISANCTEIGLFMDCQIDNPNCSLIKERFQINTLPADDFLTHDTSTIPQLVYTSHVSLSSALTGRLLQNYTGRIGGSCTKTSDCKTGESCEFGKCVYTPLAFHTVYSPRIAFSSSIDDWVLTNQCSRDSSKNDDDEPLWMVSGLSGVEFMLGITAPAFLETTILVVGIVVFILLIGLVIVLRCFFNKKMKKA
ncbi:hypothetical protein BLNAU_158 [Blattamonas nauphoetae]|uniref:Nicastrin n=1 Tax=Blattamonas nauphoetae TaxID=2049346 RepID=A0ABQ9YM71_9EUKA|nr:hypothetical protein BLNAU_158 [Blattamonas nauphoetae]